jgi:hypothetical protein
VSDPVHAFGPCWSCGNRFWFNPDLVPVIPIDGVRRQICRDCMIKANAIRTANGEAPHEIPAGSYYLAPTPNAWDMLAPWQVDDRTFEDRKDADNER